MFIHSCYLFLNTKTLEYLINESLKLNFNLHCSPNKYVYIALKYIYFYIVNSFIILADKWACNERCWLVKHEANKGAAGLWTADDE